MKGKQITVVQSKAQIQITPRVSSLNIMVSTDMGVFTHQQLLDKCDVTITFAKMTYVMSSTVLESVGGVGWGVI